MSQFTKKTSDEQSSAMLKSLKEMSETERNTHNKLSAMKKRAEEAEALALKRLEDYKKEREKVCDLLDYVDDCSYMRFSLNQVILAIVSFTFLAVALLFSAYLSKTFTGWGLLGWSLLSSSYTTFFIFGLIALYIRYDYEIHCLVFNSKQWRKFLQIKSKVKRYFQWTTKKENGV